MALSPVYVQLPLFPTHKQCARCGVLKPLTTFRPAGKTSRARDGLQAYCKPCCRDDLRAHPAKGSVIDAADVKTCTVCRMAKPNAEFRRDKSRRDGLSHRCRDCGRRLDRERHKRLSDASEPTATNGKNRKLVPQGLKVCLHCRQVKALDEFHPSAREAYGLRGRCKACECAQRRAWRERNADKIRAYHKARYPLIKQRQYEAHKIWQANNPEKVRAQWQRKRARRHRAEGKYTAQDIGRLLQERQGLCYYCGQPYGDEWHVEHKTPIARGGTNWPDNLCIACVPCNQRKHTATEEEFLRILDAQQRR